MTTRALAKAMIERGAVWSGAASIARLSRRDATLVLAYHNIVPQGEDRVGDVSLHLPQRSFARQLDRLRLTHDVVSLRDALFLPPTGERPRAVITFDDAYHGTLTAGVKELYARGLPATIFVAPGRLGQQTFWWDTLTPPGTDGIDPAIRTHALERAAGREDDVSQWAREQALPITSIPMHARSATDDTLRAAMAYTPLSLGAHSWTHPNLSRLDAGSLREELVRPLEWLSQFGDRAVPAVAYPYGLANETVHRMAEETGYDAGFMIDGGWIANTDTTRYALPRLNIPAGVTDHGFVMRASGLLTH